MEPAALVAVVLAGAAGALAGGPPVGRLPRLVADSRSGAGDESAASVAGAGPSGARGAPRRRLPSATSNQPRAALACAAAGAALVLLLGVAAGAVPGLAVALAGPRLLARLEPRAAVEHRARLRRDLPLLLDLLAACLAGGAAPAAAARAVASGVPGPAGERLAAVAAALAVGVDPPDAWLRLASGPEDPLLPAARALARAAAGGVPAATAVTRLAADARADARGRAEAAARRAGVLAVAPLGLCFLPAFVLLGVVPVVVGLAGPVLGPLR